MRFVSDLRYAARILRRSPVFTTVAVVSLALGLGANAAIFNLFDQILLRPLPVKDPRQLVMLESPGVVRGEFDGDNSDRLFSYPMYSEIRDRNQVFSGVLARYPRQVNVVNGGQGEAAQAEFVSGNFFEVLGIPPFRGRLLAPPDDSPNAPPTAVLGHGFWQRRFGANPSIIGQTIRVNSNLVTVAGVTPPGFFGVHLGGVPDVYLPLTVKAQALPNERRLGSRASHWLHLLARLKPGISEQQANAALQVLYKPLLDADLAAMTHNTERFRTRFLAKVLHARPAYNGVPTSREESEAPVKIVMGMVGLVLLIACANVANLLVARALGRQKEIAIRLSMGANRRDLVRQLLAESLLLSLTGGALGLVVAVWTSDLLVTSNSDFSKTALSASLDSRTLMFALALSLLTGLLFGLIPALQATRPNVNTVLKDQGGAVAGGFRQIRSRQALVIAQVALSLLLLIGAGLFTRSLLHLRSLDPGFNPNHMVVFSVDAARNAYDQPRIHQLYDDLRERLAAMPGLNAAAASDIVPLGGNQNVSSISIEGYRPKPEEDMNPWFDSISPGYFGALGIPLLQGREFGPQDRLGAKKVAIVNETFARSYFKDESPLGHRFGLRDQSTPDIEIVGVVKDAHHAGLQQKIERFVYVPYAQDSALGILTFQIRTAGPPEAMLNPIRKAVAEVDPSLALWDLKTMDLQVKESLWAEQMLAALCASFGAVATVLAAIGLYGVTAFNVARRTREIGIRMALGAARQNVLGMVLKEVAILCVMGLAAGLPIAVAFGNVLRSQLYGIQPTDVATLAGAAVVLLAVSLAAGLLPARRAATVDPMVALRYE